MTLFSLTNALNCNKVVFLMDLPVWILNSGLYVMAVSVSWHFAPSNITETSGSESLMHEWFIGKWIRSFVPFFMLAGGEMANIVCFCCGGKVGVGKDILYLLWT